MKKKRDANAFSGCSVPEGLKEPIQGLNFCTEFLFLLQLFIFEKLRRSGTVKAEKRLGEVTLKTVTVHIFFCRLCFMTAVTSHYNDETQGRKIYLEEWWRMQSLY